MKNPIILILIFFSTSLWAQFNKIIPLYTIPYKVGIFPRTNLDFSPDGKTLAFGSPAGLVSLYDCEKGASLFALSGHETQVNVIQFSPDGKLMASADAAGKVIFRNTTDWKEKSKFTAHAKDVVAMAFSPDGKYLMTGGKDNYVRIWDVNTGQIYKSFDKMFGNITDAKFSPCGKHVIVAMGGSGLLGNTFKGVKFFDAQNGSEQKRLVSEETINFLINAEETKMITANFNNDIGIWDATTGQKSDNITGHTAKVTILSLSPGGKILASGGADKTVKLWDWSTKTSLYSLTEHTGSIFGILFSPNGKYLATASFDNTIKIWDLSKLTLPVETAYEKLSNIQLPQEEQDILASAKNNISFDTEKSIVKCANGQSIADLAKMVQKKANCQLIIYVHTDNTIDADKAYKLSNERAEALKTYLISKKIPAAKLTVVGWGATKPVNSYISGDNIQNNSRLEFYLKE